MEKKTESRRAEKKGKKRAGKNSSSLPKLPSNTHFLAPFLCPLPLLSFADDARRCPFFFFSDSIFLKFLFFSFAFHRSRERDDLLFQRKDEKYQILKFSLTLAVAHLRYLRHLRRRRHHLSAAAASPGRPVRRRRRSQQQQQQEQTEASSLLFLPQPASRPKKRKRRPLGGTFKPSGRRDYAMQTLQCCSVP